MRIDRFGGWFKVLVYEVISEPAVDTFAVS